MIKQITKNLKLIRIEKYNFDDNDKLTTVMCRFDFFTEIGEVLITVNKLGKNYPSYSMTEISSELSDSFNDLLDDHWDEIALCAKEFVTNYESE